MNQSMNECIKPDLSTTVKLTNYQPKAKQPPTLELKLMLAAGYCCWLDKYKMEDWKKEQNYNNSINQNITQLHKWQTISAEECNSSWL